MESNSSQQNKTFLVVGAGLPRTGTLSLREALAILLEGPCYHMMSVFMSMPQDPDVDFWNALSDGGTSHHQDWREFFNQRGFRAGVDYPVSKFYKYRALIHFWPPLTAKTSSIATLFCHGPKLNIYI